MTELEDIVAQLEAAGYGVHRCHRTAWFPAVRLLILSADAPEDLLARDCARMLEQDREERWWHHGLPRPGAVPRLPPEERRANVRAAVAQLGEVLDEAGQDGLRLPELREELFMFRDVVILDALRLLRADPDVIETRERRVTRGDPGKGARTQALIVLRSRTATNGGNRAG